MSNYKNDMTASIAMDAAVFGEQRDEARAELERLRGLVVAYFVAEHDVWSANMSDSGHANVRRTIEARDAAEAALREAVKEQHEE